MTTIPFDHPVALAASGTPLLNPRSCVTCRQRKVRCDKWMPCSNCRRAQINCVYPAPGRAPRRPRPRDSGEQPSQPPSQPPQPTTQGPSKREMELMERLRAVQGIVGGMIGELNPDVQRDKSSESLPSTQGVAVVREATEEAQQRTTMGDAAVLSGQLGRLVLHDGGKTTRYVNSGFMSKLNDELDAIRNDMETDSDELDHSNDEESSPDHVSPQSQHQARTDHHSFLFGYRSADVDLSTLHPPPEKIIVLWQIYQENVEALLKVVHVPTMDKLLLGGLNTSNLVPADEALIFAIYFATIASMEDDDVQSILGVSQPHSLSQFRFALEQALAKANLLNTTDMAVLQAFTIFLTVVKRHDDSNICWTLTCLLVRMAQAVGLHRDGAQLGLPPFEVEMRRRLWWAIMAVDIRSAQEMGTDLTVSDRSFDTQLPSNINDADISPNGTGTITMREGRTDTAVCLVRYEICALHRRLFTVMSGLGPLQSGDIAKSLEERERMIIEVYDSIEQKFLKHMADDQDPIYWMASLIARVIMAKTGLILYQPVLFPGTGPELSNEIRSRLWVSTIEIVEYNYILNTDQRCQRWRWFFQTYRQWHAIAYMLLEVSFRPWTVTSERAWEAAQILGYDHPIESANTADHTAVWMPIKKLYIKAKRHRAAEIARLRSDPAAAQRLDVEDRLVSRPERLGPVPGMETRMTELRLRWRRLVRADIFSTAPQQNAARLISKTTQSPITRPHNDAGNARADEPESTMTTNPVEKSTLEMLSLPPNASDLWHMNSGDGGAPLPYEGDRGSGGGGGGITDHLTVPIIGGVIPPGNNRDQFSNSSMSSPGMFGDGMSTSDLSSHIPQEWSGGNSPFLWHDQTQFNHDQASGTNDATGLAPGDMPPLFNDIDMNLDPSELADIDWRNWQQTLKDLSKPAGSDTHQGMGRWGGT